MGGIGVIRYLKSYNGPLLALDVSYGHEQESK
jgi:hypothetical protein